ncbi:MAG: hypothetical protein ACE369_18455 [Roseovarius sp.]
MLGIILLSLLGIGAAAMLAINLFANDDDTARAPASPGVEQPVTGGATLSGTDADDGIGAGAGGDVLRAGHGNDTVNAGTGHDRVFGEAGDDIVARNAGDDSGGSKVAALDGIDLTADRDADGDVVDGDRGSDTIIFGQADTVTGGEGSDLFLGGTPLTAGAPAVITDFELNEELLVLTYDGGDAPELTVSDVGGDAVLNVGGTPAVILPGLGAAFLLSDVELIDISG